jgi:hypothetical protein
MQHPVVIGGSLEDSWDELWLSLGEELGWKAMAKIDMDALRTGIRVAVEIERRAEAGPTGPIRSDRKTRKETWKRAEVLIAGAGLAPGEVFDVSHWVGPLLEEGARERLKSVQKQWRQLGGRHPAWSVSVFDLDDRWIQPVGEWGARPSAEQVEARLTALGAPAICRAVCLPTPSVGMFEPGSRLPLSLAVELAVEWIGGMDLILLCLPGRLGYAVTHEEGSWVVHRSRS